MRVAGFMALFLGLAFGLTLLAGCEREAPPQLRTYGVWQPACILFCKGAVDQADAAGGGSVSSGGIDQNASFTGGGGL